MAEITLTQGQRIRYAREARGLDQDELAERIHVSRATLSAWEKNKNKRGVSYNDLKAIADELAFPIEFFEMGTVRFTATPILREQFIDGMCGIPAQVPGQMELLAA